MSDEEDEGVVDAVGLGEESGQGRHVRTDQPGAPELADERHHCVGQPGHQEEGYAAHGQFGYVQLALVLKKKQKKHPPREEC